MAKRKTKDRATCTPLNPEVNPCSPEGLERFGDDRKGFEIMTSI